MTTNIVKFSELEAIVDNDSGAISAIRYKGRVKSKTSIATYSTDASGNVTGLVDPKNGGILSIAGGSSEVGYLKAPTIGFAGDSIGVMWAAMETGDSPIAFVKFQSYPCELIKIFNSSVGGTSSSHLISTQIEQLEALSVKPTIMVVQTLQNDSMTTEGGADTFLAYVTQYATRALAAGVQAVCICSRPPKSESAAGVPSAIAYINRKLDEFCRATTGCYYIDVFNAWRNWNVAEATTRINFKNTAGTPTAFSDDGTHPLPRAMQVVAPLIEPIIRRYARPITPTSMSLNAYNDATGRFNNLYGADGLFIGTNGQLNGVDNTNVAGTGTTNGTRWKITTANGVTVTPSIVVGADGSNYQQLVLGGTATLDTDVTLYITPATNVTLGNWYLEGLVKAEAVAGVKHISLSGLNAKVGLHGAGSTVSEIDIGTRDYHFRSNVFSKEVTNFAAFNGGLVISVESGASPTGTIRLGRFGVYRVSVG